MFIHAYEAILAQEALLKQFIFDHYSVVQLGFVAFYVWCLAVCFALWVVLCALGQLDLGFGEGTTMPKVMVEVGSCKAYCALAQVRKVVQQLQGCLSPRYSLAAGTIVDFIAEPHSHTGALLPIPLSDMNSVFGALRKVALKSPKGELRAAAVATLKAIG